MKAAQRYFLVLLVFVAFALGVAACGGDDDRPASSAPPTASTTTTTAAPPPPPSNGSKSEGSAPSKRTGDSSTAAVGAPSAAANARVATAVRRFIAAMRDADASALCDLSSRSTRRALAQAQVPRGSTCEQVMRAFASSAQQALSKQFVGARATDIEIHGDSATATIATAQGSFPATLVREDGEWKLSSG